MNTTPDIFNNEFRSLLETKVQMFLDKSVDFKGWWCDGINPLALEDPQLSIETITRLKSIFTTTWIGKDGQGNFYTEIKLGEKALSNYLKNRSLIECLPNAQLEE